MRTVFVTTFLFLKLNFLFSQLSHTLHVTCADKPNSFFTKKLSYKNVLRDSMQASNEYRALLSRIQNAGYPAASVDSIISDSIRTHIHIYVGDFFEKITLENGNVDESLLSDAGVKNVLTKQKPISINNIEQIKARILRECENTGYPFAIVRLDSFTQNNQLFNSRLYLQKNDIIRIDTIRIVGKTKVKRVFLKNYLGLKTNRPYNEANIKKITQRLNELQFVEPVQPHTVEFQNGKAAINLYLRDKRASQFNFLLGFLPGGAGQKLLVTGEARIHLFSPFGMGEEIFLEWQKLQPKTQRLDIRFSYPYIAGLPLGISARFELYKRDTSYLDLDGDYGVQYQFVGSNYLKASLRQKTTIVLNVDTALLKASRRLPGNLDISTNHFSLEYFFQKLNYRFNPVSGYVIKASGSIGVKKIKRNNSIIGLSDELTNGTFAFLYDTTRLKTLQFSLGFAIDKYWKLANRHTIKTSFDGKYFFSRTVLQNEKYRLGGVSSLRGFEDQSIFTPYYIMANLEYRFLLSKNSYFQAFFNAAMVEDPRAGKGPFDFPFGFGAGAAIETKIGLFGITYALGRQLDNKIAIKDSKIHIGYVNYF
jgi:outer membrane protein assembly factor BamA